MRALLQVAAAILIGYLIGRRQAKNRQEEEADEAAKAAEEAEARRAGEAAKAAEEAEARRAGAAAKAAEAARKAAEAAPPPPEEASPQTPAADPAPQEDNARSRRKRRGLTVTSSLSTFGARVLSRVVEGTPPGEEMPAQPRMPPESTRQAAPPPS